MQRTANGAGCLVVFQLINRGWSLLTLLMKATKTPAIAKTLLVMKLTLLLLALSVLMVHARGDAQKITLQGRQVSLSKVITAIKKQAGYAVLCNKEVLKAGYYFDLAAQNQPLQEFLSAIAREQPLRYTIEGKTVFISTGEKLPVLPSPPVLSVKETPPPPLLVDVKGRVVDEEGKPVAGASVQVKGATNKGVSTDANGYFELKNVDENAILIITGVNIEAIQVTVNGRTSIKVDVKTKIAEGADVIVNAGYYNVKKREATGTISKVTAAEIERQPVGNPLAALPGRVPGMIVTQSSGVPGSSFTIQIRGLNSLRNTQADNGNVPLYIIDGVPFTATTLSTTGAVIGLGNPLNAIDPSSIESIEVLKDADATAIYGSRGANGVILITTKKGVKGKLKVDLNMYSGVGNVPKKMKLLNTQQYLEMRREAFRNDGVTSTTANARDLLLWDTTRYTDWQDVLIGGTANFTKAQISVSGGNEHTQFLIAGNYFRETTVFPGDFADQRFFGQFNLSHTSVDKKFRISLSANYSVENNQLLNQDLTNQALTLSPNAPKVFDSLGNLNWENNTWTNPFSITLRSYKARVNNFISNLVISYQLARGLTFKTSLGYTAMDLNEMQLVPKNSQNPFSTTAQSLGVYGNGNTTTWIVEPQLEYSVAIGTGKLNILAGSTTQQSVRESQSFQGTGFTSDALIENLAAAATIQLRSTNYTKYRYQSIFGRINYNMQGKYLVNLTVRRDGSSRFGPNRQFGNFGAVGAAWVFSKENFFKIPAVSLGKLRVSYGSTGSDQIADYGFMDLWGPMTNPYGGGGSITPERLVNPNFSWEATRKFETAVEFGFLNDRLLLAVNHYRNRSSNQLVGYPLSSITGFSSVQFNLPATVENTGFEFELLAVVLKSKNVSWESSFNLTIPKNKLVDYPGIEGSSYRNTYEVGKSLFIQKRYRFLGVDSQTGINQFEDVDGSGAMNFPGDVQAIKENAQHSYGGWQNSLRLGQFQFDLFLHFAKQTGNSYIRYMPNIPGMLANQPALVLNRWQKPGDMTDIQKFSQSTGSTAYRAYYSTLGDHVLVDASFLRIKNIQLAYNLPDQIAQKIRISGARIYCQGQNLLTFTNYEGLGLDPENQTYTSLPPLRTITFGIQLIF